MLGVLKLCSFAAQLLRAVNSIAAARARRLTQRKDFADSPFAPPLSVISDR